MSFEFDQRWIDAGWVPVVASVQRNRAGREQKHGQRHPLAPGLVVHEALDGGGSLTVTHVASGLQSGLLSNPTWTGCPIALRDVLVLACKELDFESITVENAPYVDKEKLNNAKKAVDPLYGHKCEVCMDQFYANLDREIQELEAELRRAEQEVENCHIALSDAEEDVLSLSSQLAGLRAQKKARESK
jgi:hypothetical protein